MDGVFGQIFAMRHGCGYPSDFIIGAGTKII